MRRLSALLAAAGVVVTLALCAFVDPSKVGPVGALAPSQLGGGDTGLRLSAVMQYDGYEGGEPTVIASSHGLPYDHLMSGSYRYVPAAYATHVGQSAVAWTKFDYFGGAASSHYADASLTAFGLYDGDSLQVRTTIAAAADSGSVLDSKTTTYLIDHDVVTLAMGNPYGGTLFNPSGLTPSQTVTCTAANFRSARLRGGTQADSLSSWTLMPSSTFMRGATTFNPIQDGAAVEKAFLWWDLSSIPDDVTIVEAYLCLDMQYANNVALSASEGLYAVLDTLSADTQWIAANQRAAAPYINNTSHNEPRRGLETAWSPLLNSRTAAWHYGIQSPLAHDITGNTGVLAAGDDVLINVKEILQYWVDFHDVRGIRNSGFLISGYKSAGGSYQISLGDEGTTENVNPTLIVRYQSKKYSGYDWGDYPFVFVFTTDDQHRDNFDFYKPLFDARGITYTLFAAGADVGNNRMTSAQMLQMHNEGYEIANHGLTHRYLYNVPQDSIGYYLNRSWLATILGLSGADTMQIGSYGYAYGDTTDANGGASAVIDRLNAYGYRSARLAWNVSGSTWPTQTNPDAASEIFKVGNWRWDAFADVDDTAADSIRAKLRKVYGYSAYYGGVDGGLPLTVLSHGTVAGSSYDEMDPIPLGLLLDEIQRRGDTWICTFDQMMSLYRSTHEAAGAGGKVWVPK